MHIESNGDSRHGGDLRLERRVRASDAKGFFSDWILLESMPPQTDGDTADMLTI